jgi:hypothetical protein
LAIKSSPAVAHGFVYVDAELKNLVARLYAYKLYKIPGR